MVVCAHGEVEKFCENHEMQILERHEGNLEDYKGSSIVVVTDQKMTREEYDRLKCTMFGRGVELVSTDWTDDEVILRLLRNQVENRKKRGGRQKFGFYKRNGQIVENPAKITVARKVIELRDAGCKLREIQGYEGVCYPDGTPLSLSTIQTIIDNREVYEK